MTKKTILITGSTAGIGLAGAEALANMGWRVLVHGRSETRLGPVLDGLRSRVGGGDFEGVTGDLGSLAGVADLAAQVKRMAPVLDALWNNAGGLQDSLGLTAEGLELQMAINYLAPFALTRLLIPQLGASPGGRIVATSSMAHAFAPRGTTEWLRPEAGKYRPFPIYGKSKLALILFTQELARRLAGKKLSANSYHPGWVNSSFGSGGDPGKKKSAFALVSVLALSTEKGADTGVWLVDDAAVTGKSGLYWSKRRVKEPSKEATPEAAAMLWEQSEAAVVKALGPLPAL